MSSDQLLQEAGSRLNSAHVDKPELNELLDHPPSRRRVAAGIGAGLLVVAATAVLWIGATRGNSSPGTSGGAAASSATSDQPDDLLPSYELDRVEAELVEDETITATNAATATWADLSQQTYASLTIRPGLGANQRGPTGLGRMRADPTFPADQGQAWISDFSSPQHSATLWWQRTNGDVWILGGYWYFPGGQPAEAAAITLRTWALDIAAADETGDHSELAPGMLLFDQDDAGSVRSRVQVWNLPGGTVTVSSIERSAATGLANLVAHGAPQHDEADGQERWSVLDEESGEVIVGWRTATQTWTMLTITGDPRADVESIVEALRSD